MIYSDFALFGYYPHFPPNAPAASNSAMTVNRTLSRVVMILLLLPILSGCGWFKAKKDPLETLPVAQIYSKALEPLDYGNYVNAERSKEQQSAVQSLMRTSYAVICLKNK